MDFSQLTANDQQAMEAIVARKQMKDFSRLFTSLVDRCFTSCVDDFTSRSLTSREDECVSKCTQKFLKHSERVGARFQEENQKIAGGN
ncbi:putative TIM9-translocase of the mitochondrial inner membrane [Jaminaea rosea]|uniref:Mitochondrial import inner membrane translocase subunit n=1 Tax=Jaminaea rosea TaxID=1569628 RepID=A0A316UQA0_9BASI|nr:putative TIM9-translocase of the mitochondrial inner membrane [Jaminaea rosea]PWN27479.1 putative TIM9-translocase of the mitochondrial inner membrane [Jaminaea rosea]